MAESRHDLEQVLAAYAADVVRWNRQINLVSRQDTSKRVDELVIQCRLAGESLLREVLGEWPMDAAPLYFDLGSGGGLPGVVWHQLLRRRFPEVVTTLVEPREKRAWFLERQVLLDPEHPLHVRNGRWGEVTGAVGPGSGPTRGLVSLKALHLTDPEVIRGWEAFFPVTEFSEGSELVISRFSPPDQAWDHDLAAELEALAPEHDTDRASYVDQGRFVLAPGKGGSASLVVHRYAITPRIDQNS